MSTAAELRKRVKELTAALTKMEAVEKAEKEWKEMERKRKAEAKRKAEQEEREAAEKAAKTSKRKTSRFIVPDSDSEEVSEVPDAEKACSACIKRGCKCVMVQVSPSFSCFNHSDADPRVERQSEVVLEPAKLWCLGSTQNHRQSRP